jgi:hypothetical protein
MTDLQVRKMRLAFADYPPKRPQQTPQRHRLALSALISAGAAGAVGKNLVHEASARCAVTENNRDYRAATS